LYLESEHPSNLTLFTFTAGIESDLLVGAKMISTIRTCYFGLEIFGLAPMFTYYANRGEIKILEETEASLAFGLRAQMAGINFMPGLGWIGTDLPKLRPDVQTIIDPYSGEELMAFPAIKPDVAVIHSLYADSKGNAIIGKNKGVDEELAITADRVIITSEEIVPELTRADIPSPFVDVVVAAPKGAQPTSCHPMYPLNGEEILNYVESVSNPDSWKLYVENLITL
jgi:glutaconate CoA-transferase subunit A